MAAPFATFILAAIVSGPASPTSCTTPQEVINAASISALATPDSSMLGLKLVAPGFRIDQVTDVAWRGCTVKLRPRVFGDWIITESGVPLRPAGKQLITRNDPIPPPEPEPEHPTIAGDRFISSTSLLIGNQRAGLWMQKDGRSLIARYKPGTTDAPAPLLISIPPIIGLFYLPAPDAPGGALLFWQRLPHEDYRYIRLPWTEEGVR